MATDILETGTDADTAATTAKPKKVIPFNQQIPSQLAKVDVQTLAGEELMAYAQAAKDRLDDLQASVYTDKRTGMVFLGTRLIGNVNRPVAKVTGVIPSVLKIKDEHYNPKTEEVKLPADAIAKGCTALDNALVATIRCQMARIKGNGVNLLNQQSKDDAGAALAMGICKSGSL